MEFFEDSYSFTESRKSRLWKSVVSTQIWWLEGRRAWLFTFDGTCLILILLVAVLEIFPLHHRTPLEKICPFHGQDEVICTSTCELHFQYLSIFLGSALSYLLMELNLIFVQHTILQASHWGVCSHETLKMSEIPGLRRPMCVLVIAQYLLQMNCSIL